MKAGNHSLDMTKGPLLKEIVVFTIPLILSGLLNLCFNAADMVVVGRLGTPHSLGAVGATSSFCIFLITIFIGLSIGTNVVVATRFGMGDRRGMSRAVHTATAIALIGGLVLLAVGQFVSRGVLALTGVPEGVLDSSTLYMRVFCCGIPFNLLFQFGSAILRAVGDTRRPLYYLTVAGVVNVVLNLIFVLALRKAGKDVAGVALATVASQAISSILVLRALSRTHGACRLRLRLLRIDMPTLREIVGIGLPAGIQSSMFSAANIIIQSGVNSFKNASLMDGNAAASNIEGFVHVATSAYYQAVTTIVGQNLGARKYGRIVRSFIYCMGLAVALNIVAGVAVSLFATQAVAFYNGDPDVIHYGVVRLKVLIFTYALCSAMDVITGTLRGLGDSMYPAVVTLVGACLLRIVWVLFVFPLKHEQWFLYLCFPISWVVVSVVNGEHLRKKLGELRRSHLGLHAAAAPAATLAAGDRR